MTSNVRLRIFNWMNRILPDVGRLNCIRVSVLRWAGVKVAKTARVGAYVSIRGGGVVIVVGDNATIGSNTHLSVYNGRFEMGQGARLLDGCRVNIENGGSVLIGDYVSVKEECFIEAVSGTTSEYKGGKLRVGEGAYISFRSVLSANGGATVDIGDHCEVAHNVSIKATEHTIMTDSDSKCIAGVGIYRDISIGAGSWICAGVTVLPGVRIGKKVIVGAGAVVTKDVPDSALAVGVPATVKKLYLTKENNDESVN